MVSIISHLGQVDSPYKYLLGILLPKSLLERVISCTDFIVFVFYNSIQSLNISYFCWTLSVLADSPKQTIHLSVLFFSAMKIHISDPTRRLLDIYGNFITEERGTIEVKVHIKFFVQYCGGYHVIR